MDIYIFTNTPDSLKIQRNRLPPMILSVITSLPLLGMTALLYNALAIQHARLSGSILGLGVMDLVSLTFPYSQLCKLPKKIVMLDRGQNIVQINGERECALTNVKSVHLGKIWVPTKNFSSSQHGLLLKLTDGNAVLIEGNLGTASFGPDIKELAQKVADFLHVPLYM